MADRRTLLSVGTFLGTVIGVGVFGLPYLAAQMGLLPFMLLLVVLLPLVLIIHLRFVDVVIGTDGEKRIPGYVAHYLGARMRPVSLVVSSLGLLGSLLAYLIIGGTFVQLFIRPLGDVPHLLAVLVFFLFGSALIARGTKSVAMADSILIAFFFLLVIVFFVLAVPKMDTAIFRNVVWAQTPAGYGVLLFSLWGLSLVPETVGLAERDRRRSRMVLMLGLALTAIVYCAFVVMVLGVTGHQTTSDALSGFLLDFPAWVGVIGGALGIIATFTSYVALGVTFKKTLHYDLGVRPTVALGLSLFAPLVLVLAGFRDFIDVVGITGAVLLGCEGAFVLLVADRFRSAPRRRVRVGTILLIGVLLLGTIVELWSFFR